MIFWQLSMSNPLEYFSGIDPPQYQVCRNVFAKGFAIAVDLRCKHPGNIHPPAYTWRKSGGIWLCWYGSQKVSSRDWPPDCLKTLLEKYNW